VCVCVCVRACVRRRALVYDWSRFFIATKFLYYLLLALHLTPEQFETLEKACVGNEILVDLKVEQLQ
jgi:hypothetical protein